MLRSQLSILGLYNYDPDIFSGFQVPEGMDRTTAIDEILMNCAELEIIYPSYTTMKLAIKNWTTAELPIWERALRDMTIEYNPIWNVDGTETEVIERELTGNTKDDNISASERTGSEAASGGSSTTTEAESIESSKAYNQDNTSEWAERDKTAGDGSTTVDSTEERESSESIEATDNRTIQESEKETITTTKTRGGNIGVTMTQQMLNADLDMLPRLNPYQFIVESFKNRFCLLIY